MKQKSGQVSDKVWFYRLGLGDQNWVNEKKWEIKTLKQIRQDLKHENVSTLMPDKHAIPFPCVN